MPYNMYLPQRGKSEVQGEKVLAVDIGGTKTNLGLFEVQGDRLSLLREDKYPSREYAAFEEIVQKFMHEDASQVPTILSIGVAGPVINNKVKLTNLSWELDAQLLARDLKIARVSIINDLEATAYGLAGLSTEDVLPLFDQVEDVGGNMAVLAPGTGLGEAGIFWDGESYRPFATEGGHSDFAPRTELDVELYNYIRQDNDIVCWEHIVSGPGIYRIYKFLRDVKGCHEPAWLTENFKKDDNSPAVISHAALRELDTTCILTMELLVTYMAREATSLVLKHKATGGLFLGGGIPPRIFPLLRKELFRKQFIQNQHMGELLDKIPVRVILNSKAALIGAGYYGAFG